MVSDVFNMLLYADVTTLDCNIDQNVSDEVLTMNYQMLVNGLQLISYQ